MATPAPVTLEAGSQAPIAAASDNEPAAKRFKTLACSRCRRRKQKCDDQRPCANCTRAGVDCHEVAPKIYQQGTNQAPQVPLAWVGSIPYLEERLSRLEHRMIAGDEHHSELSRDPDNVTTASWHNPHTNERGHHRELSDLDRDVYRDRRDDFETSASVARGGAASIGLLSTLVDTEDGTSLGRSSSSPLAYPDNIETEAGPRKPRHSTQLPEINLTTEQALFGTYHEKIHVRYPFLLLFRFQNPNLRPREPWAGFFTNMIFSIAILTARGLPPYLPFDTHQLFYREAIDRYLPLVLAHPDRVLHVQAHLLLSMHALHSPSSERLISAASATMRYCVLAQMHLADAEPRAQDAAAKVMTQLRRRVFWSAYVLDRAIGTMYNLPFSIPDYQITVRMYANIDEAELEERCKLAFPGDPASQPCYTSVSSALHVLYCRQIQSEILNTTLHRDFENQFDHLSNWRLAILEKLDSWKSLCQWYTDSQSKTMTSKDWLYIIYHYSLVMLFRPTKTSVYGPAGDWTVKATVQAILIFRRFQKNNAVNIGWVALIAQFKCGVALLYCFFATPPAVRSASYADRDVGEAIRACSIVLSLLAERWSEAACIRDAFDVLAREVPLMDPPPLSASADAQPQQRRIAPDSAKTLNGLLPRLERRVVHRDTLRMIREMANEPFPRPESVAFRSPEADNATKVYEGGQTGDLDDDGGGPDHDTVSQHTAATGDIFQPMMPHFFMPELSNAEVEGFDYAALGFADIFDLEQTQ